MTDFASDFREVHAELADRWNCAMLHDLRDALAGYSREQFDAGLRELRRNREYTLTPLPSVSGLTEHQVSAGIIELGVLLLVCEKVL